jgi:hypothetical protein
MYLVSQHSPQVRPLRKSHPTNFQVIQRVISANLFNHLSRVDSTVDYGYTIEVLRVDSTVDYGRSRELLLVLRVYCTVNYGRTMDLLPVYYT